MADVFRFISKRYSNFGTERVRAFSVREDGVGNRLPHEVNFSELHDQLCEAGDEYQNHKKGSDTTFLVLVGEVLKGLDSASRENLTRLDLERRVTKVRAAILAALAFADALFDGNYRPRGSSEEGKDEQAETLVLTLKNTLDAITPENLNLDGQTLLLVDITVRPENSEKVLDAVRQVLASLSSHPSMEGIRVDTDGSDLLV